MQVVRRLDLDLFSVQESLYPPLYRMAPHADGQTRVSVLVAGGVEETACGAACWSGPGSAVVKPVGTVHANRFGPIGARILSVLPSHTLVEELSGEGALAPSRYVWCHRGRKLALADSIRQVLDRPTASSLFTLKVCLTDLLGRDARPAKSRPPSWLESARSRLHTDPTHPQAVGGLAAAAGVHPVYFARAFRQYYRCTVREYIRHLRVLNAADLLAVGDMPLAQVALEAGFADQPHFCRVFHRETGTTPSAYRRSHFDREVSFVQSPTSARR